MINTKKDYLEVFIQIAGFNLKLDFFLQKNNQEVGDDLRRRKEFIYYFKKIFKNYIVPHADTIDYLIVIESSETIFKNDRNNTVLMILFKTVSEKKIKTYYYISIFQLQLVIRDIIFKLVIKNDGCIIHASAVVVENKANLFLGKSTAGKSTIVRLLKNSFMPIADDTVVIKLENGKYFVQVSPFLEKQRWIKKENKKYEIRNVFFIHKSNKTTSLKIENSLQVLDSLIEQLFIAEENMRYIVQWGSVFAKSEIQFYHLSFRKRTKDLESELKLINKIA